MGQPDQPVRPEDHDRFASGGDRDEAFPTEGADEAAAGEGSSTGSREFESDGRASEDVLRPLPSISKRPARNHVYPGSEILSDRSPRVILERILDGDPLDMDGRCFLRLRHNATLIDADRLYNRATAWVAHQATAYDGTPPLADWLNQCIDSTIRNLLDEDMELERQGIPPTTPWDPAFSFLTETLGVEPPIARKCAVVFNNLPIPVRKSFWVVVMQGKSLNRAVAEGLGPPEKAEGRVRYAMGMMSTLGNWVEPNPDPQAPSWIYEEDQPSEDDQ